MLGSTEILVICGVVVLLFGASALPKFARSIGKAKSEFQRGIREETEVPVGAEGENYEYG